jgi:ribosomal protein S18 acetylase RimI-like enzyme
VPLNSVINGGVWSDNDHFWSARAPLGGRRRSRTVVKNQGLCTSHLLCGLRKLRTAAATSYLLLDNVAVSPARQGSGLGRRLLAFAEAEALRRGYAEIRLYTHQTMEENQRLYASIGYEETGRGAEAGYDRVFMRKQLRG